MSGHELRKGGHNKFSIQLKNLLKYTSLSKL